MQKPLDNPERYSFPAVVSLKWNQPLMRYKQTELQPNVECFEADLVLAKCSFGDWALLGRGKDMVADYSCFNLAFQFINGMTVDSSRLILTLGVEDYYKKFGFSIIEAAGAVLRAILKCQKAFRQL